MRIGIVGGGVVGKATASAFIGWGDCEVFVYDVAKERATHPLGDVLACDLIFVCLPTPQKPWSLQCDTSYIEKFFADLRGPDHDYTACNFVLRSTVPIGFTRKLQEKHGLKNLVHSPEFLTARTAKEDAANPVRNIIGLPIASELLLGAIGVGRDSDCWVKLINLYQLRFDRIGNHIVTSDESEAVKLFQNGFSAIKVSTFNELYKFAEAQGLCWERVLEALLAGGWINPMHTQVPGPDGKTGFGGSCLPGTATVQLDSGKILTLSELSILWKTGLLVRIRSTDSTCCNIEYKEVISVVERDYSGDLIVFETEGGEFSCTPEHLMPVLRSGVLMILPAYSILDTDSLFIDDSLIEDAQPYKS